MHEELHASTMAGFSVSMESAESLKAMLIWVYVSMAGILLLVALCIFLPILCNIESSKDAIVVRFVELPLQARRMLYLRAVRRTRTLKRNYLSNDEDEDDDEDEEEEGAAAALIGQVAGVEAAGTGQGGESGEDAANQQDLEGGGDAMPFGEDEDGEANFDWQAVLGSQSMRSVSRGTTLSRSASRSPSRSVSTKFGASGSASVAPMPSGSRRGQAALAKKKKGATERPYRKSSRSFLVLVLRFIGPLLCLLIFFSVIFGVSMVELESVVGLSSAAMAANLRAMCAREYQMDLRKVVSDYAPRSFLLDIYIGVLDVGEWMLYNSELLQFGVPANAASRGQYVDTTPPLESGTSSYLTAEESETVNSVMFSDACPFLAASLPDALYDPYTGKERITKEQYLQRCRSFGNGMIQEGMQAFMKEYIRKMNTLADRRFRARLGPRTLGLEDHGLLIPKSVYNYTVELSRVNGDEDATVFDAYADRSQPLPPPRVPDIDAYDGDFTFNPNDGSLVPTDDTVNLTQLIAAGVHLANYSVRDELNSEALTWILEADQLYLTPGLAAVADVYSTATANGIATLQSFLIIFSASYLSAFVLFMALVFLPQVSRANVDVISKRNVLLYVPVEVAAYPPIKRLIKDILAADADRHGYGYSAMSAGGGGGGGSQGGGAGLASGGMLKATTGPGVPSSGMATVSGTAGRGAGMLSGGGPGADLSAAARMADGGLPLSRTRSFHGDSGSSKPNRLTAADV